MLATSSVFGILPVGGEAWTSPSLCAVSQHSAFKTYFHSGSCYHPETASPTLSGSEPPDSGLCGLELRGFFSPVDILDGTHTSLLRTVLCTVGYFRSIPKQPK